MDDIEMMELAAEAAGYKIEWVGNAGCHYWCGDKAGDGEWCPLDDDGDALRLAVTLSISLQWCASGRVYAYWDGGEADESSREDRQANLRRAIVRAAAKIGEGGDKA